VSKVRYETRQCSRDSCRFRFPALTDDAGGLTCPRCGAPARLAIGATAPIQPPPCRQANGHLIVEGFLDNIRSAYNVGAIFRTADGAGIRHLHLAGITPTPFHSRVRKTALGSEKTVPWTHHRNGLDAVVAMSEQGYKILALENSPDAVSLFDGYEMNKAEEPVLLIVGNEISGIDRGILNFCHQVFALPMVGIKSSLNVEVTFGVAAYYLRFQRS
jgi:23S rRNA (guanosine2251-2'-O)-methyltransferase